MYVPRGEKLPYPATLSDLFDVDGKAELIADRVVVYPLMGAAPAFAATEIVCALARAEDAVPGGRGFGPAVVYAVPQMASGRQSFCPDGSFHTGPWPDDPMSWIEGAPRFAVEMRVLEDYTDGHDAVRADKRADYFEAGTLVVWDVDPVAETVTCYRASDPDTPIVFRRGQVADAEPAVPGWRLNVDDLFR